MPLKNSACQENNLRKDPCLLNRFTINILISYNLFSAVMIQSADSTVPVPEISGGPINDTYVFQQLHFHWGQNDNVGSEDLINNHSFSMELHAVFYKKSHESYAEAMKHPDGLTVLGYLYQVIINYRFNVYYSSKIDISKIESLGIF